MDNYIKVAQELLIPACKRHGSRLVAAWIGNYERVFQTTQIFEFDDIEALKNFRIAASQDKEWGEYTAQLEVFAPERRTRLLEPVGAVPPEVLHKAIEESQKSPLKVYSMAILEVNPGKMSNFIASVAAGYKVLPIIASWQPTTGNPNQVIDIWKGDVLFSAEAMAYRPFSKDQQWVRQLRENAPKERIVPLYALPYSPLK
ncbi:MAG: NIPSNAP family protein [Candidatus Lokiarchaeota archaeon]|nr:NIPSNAP family protein [Candidatus Lokiarchaeota archaeon]